MVRLLTEPRQEEAKQNRLGITNSSNRHSNRRPLDSSEEDLYGNILSLLKSLAEKESNEDELEFLSTQEYKLGMFFRKKSPKTAVDHFRRCVTIMDLLTSTNHNSKEIQKQREIVPFWLATLDKGATVSKCPADYIVGLYSTFASDFDALLIEKLQYQTPTKLRTLLDSSSNTKVYDKVLDLGCGTGLSGLAVQDAVGKELHGVDLSPDMIEKAKSRACYHQLKVADVALYLSKQSDKSWDLIWACDLFCYIGDLADVMLDSYRSLAVGGIFAFSTELLLTSGTSSKQHPEVPYRLHECARFSHSFSYLESLALNCGFGILAKEFCPIRKNKGEHVQGTLLILQRTK